MSENTPLAAQEVLKTLFPVSRMLHATMRHGHQTWRPAHFGLLLALSHHPLNLTTLAEKRAVSLPTISATISTLVERGWVERRPAQQDRRQVEVIITQAGLAELAKMQAEVAGFIQSALTNLSDEEVSDLRRGLSLLRKAFSQHFDSEHP